MSKFLDLDDEDEYSLSRAFRKEQQATIGESTANFDSLSETKPARHISEHQSSLPTLDRAHGPNNHSSSYLFENDTAKNQSNPRHGFTTNSHPNVGTQNGVKPKLPLAMNRPLQYKHSKIGIIPSKNIQSPIPSRLKSPANGSSSPPGYHSNTSIRRLSKIDDGSLKNRLNPHSSLQINPKRPAQMSPYPQKISLASIKIPDSTTKSLSTVNNLVGFIDLTSDDDDDDEEKGNYKGDNLDFDSTKIRSENVNPISSEFKDLKSSPNPFQKAEISTTSDKDQGSNVFTTFSKFSYNDIDSDQSESDNDDLIITGIKKKFNPQLVDKIKQNENEIPILPDTSIKRSFDTSNEEELNKKRQQILKNKMSMIESNVKKEEHLQMQLEKRAKIEQDKQEQERINKLLEGYPPIKSLPQKYQIQFPTASDFVIETEPVLPDIITEREIIEDRMAKVATPLKVTTFRDQHLSVMHSIIHRLNKFNELHSKLDIFLKNAAIMRNEVQEKAKKASGIPKADIRYNQILRFFDSKIKTISKFYGEIGMKVDTLKEFRKEILDRAKKMEEERRKQIYQRFSNREFKPLETYIKVLPELNLIINTITEMYKLSEPDSPKTLTTIREFSLTPVPLPRIVLPSVKFEDSSIKEIIDLDQAQDLNNSDSRFSSLNVPGVSRMDEDDDIIASDTPFDRNSDYMPFSNVYSDHGQSLNHYATNLNDSEGIKNLMESIKVIEFKEEGLANTPEELCISLLKHQRIGLSWMLKSEEGTNRGGILADDMGLGKTVQAISVMLANPSKDENRKINLVVGPVSLLHQWQQEIAMKIQSGKKLKTYLYHSTNKLKTFRELCEFDVVLVSYHTLGSEWKKHYEDQLRETNGDAPRTRRSNRAYISPFYSNDAVFYRILLDEAQYIKNRNTIASKSVASLTSTYRWCLSGTPIQNKIDELYPLIRFLGIKPYNDWKKFSHQIVQTIKRRSVTGTQKVHALLSAILLRRTKDSEIDGKPILTLPEKHIIEEKVTMDSKEKEFYGALEAKSAKAADKLLNSKFKTYSSILTLLLRMRQACDHEYLVRLGDDDDRISKLERFTQGFAALKDYPEGVISQIERERETGFTCISCQEELAETQVLLFSKCGHPICYGCHAEYFEEHAETEWDGNISAKCTKCGVLNLSSMSVDLRLYEAYENGLEWQQIRKKFDLDSKAADRNWRLSAVEKFVHEDGKLLVSAKIRKTIELVERITAERPGEKIIIFSQFMGYFDILQMELRKKHVKFLQYDGSMNVVSKNECISEFYKNPAITVLLLSLKAGNVGLTLTCANHVIISEPFWNPYVEKQAQDRVHRISQTREVFVHRLLISGTVEDRIMTLQKEKEELVEGALDPTARTKIGKLSRSELGFLFGLNGLAQLEDA